MNHARERVERALALPAARAWPDGATARPRRVASPCLFTQAGPGAPLLIARRLALGGRAWRGGRVRPPG